MKLDFSNVANHLPEVVRMYVQSTYDMYANIHTYILSHVLHLDEMSFTAMMLGIEKSASGFFWQFQKLLTLKSSPGSKVQG